MAAWPRSSGTSLPSYQITPSILSKGLRHGISPSAPGGASAAARFASGPSPDMFWPVRTCARCGPAESRPEPRFGHDPFVEACSGVTIKPKYVNMADIIFSRDAGQSAAATRPRRRRGRADLGPDRAFVLCLPGLRLRSGPRAGEVRLRPRASPGAAFRQPQSRHEGRGPARHPAHHQAVARPRAQAAGRRGLCACRRKAPDDRRQRLLFVTPKGEELAMKLAGLQTERITRALAGLGPNAHEAARDFLAAMIDADEPRRGAALHRPGRRAHGSVSQGGEHGGAGSRASRQRAAPAGGRRRPAHPRSAVALPVRRRLSRHHGGQRRGCARQAREPVVRPAHPRRDDAGRNRLPAREVAARILRRADPDAHREGRDRKPHHRAGARRRRLRAEAVRAARAVAAHRQHPQAHHSGAAVGDRVGALRRLRVSSRARRAARAARRSCT